MSYKFPRNLICITPLTSSSATLSYAHSSLVTKSSLLLFEHAKLALPLGLCPWFFLCLKILRRMSMWLNFLPPPNLCLNVLLYKAYHDHLIFSIYLTLLIFFP